ncbi:MAG: hypothetical protein ACK5Q5_16530 [Planctomycetaceae bacterium]
MATAAWVLAAFVGYQPIWADDAGASQSPLAREIEQQFGPVRSTSSSTAEASTIPQQMRLAGRELAAGRTELALRQQRQLLDSLDALLSTVPPASQPGDPSSSPESQLAGAESGSPEDAGRQQGGPGAGAAREASSQSTPGRSSSVGVVERRRGLATAVWGHLPDREREQMMQAYDDEFLPEYAELVESYYEALAAERLSQPLAD